MSEAGKELAMHGATAFRLPPPTVAGDKPVSDMLNFMFIVGMMKVAALAVCFAAYVHRGRSALAGSTMACQPPKALQTTAIVQPCLQCCSLVM
jgi:hypothetical protein